MNHIDNLINSVYSIYPRIGQNKTEILELSKVIYKLSPKNVLEIGTQYGGTFYLLSKLSNCGKKISVDLEEGIHGGISIDEIKNRNKFLESEFTDIHFLNSDSHEQSTLKKVEKILDGESVDVLFIDGDHTYDGVKKDFEMYRHLVRDGGMIIFHDINYMSFDPSCEVYKFWDELKNKEEFKKYSIYEINHNCSWVSHNEVMGGIGVIQT